MGDSLICRYKETRLSEWGTESLAPRARGSAHATVVQVMVTLNSVSRAPLTPSSLNPIDR